MNNQLIIYPALMGMLFTACGQSEKDSYTDSMQNEVASKGPGEGDDINTMQNLEDPKPLGQIELVDTLQLPEPLMVILQKDPATAVEKIKNVRNFNENGIDYYEITFDNPVKEKQVITYDELGRVRSQNLENPKN